MLRKQPSLFVLAWVVVGIVAADRLRLPSWPPLLTAAFVVVMGLYALLRERPAVGAAMLCAGLGLLGAFHYSLNHVDIGPRHIENFARLERKFRIYGRVADWPDLRQNRTEIKLAVDSLRAGETYPVQGAVLLKISDTTTALQRGDRIEFTGRIYSLPENGADRSFDYGRYLNLKGVQGIVYLNTLLNLRVDRRPSVGLFSLVDNIREAITSSLHRNLSPTAAALAGGFLIGETRDIPVEIYEMFRDSGTLHLLAVSGSNVALVLAFVLALMRPFQFRPFARSMILLAVILLFAGLSYGEPSVIRASVMASLVIVARLLRRTYDLNNIIALTALIILLVDPAQLFDVGFQLSFVTAWGLILLVPKVCAPLKPYHGRWWYRGIVFPLIVSVVAQICSTPIVAFYFGRIPVISIFANLVIVVMVSIGVVAILAMLIIDLIWPLLGLMAGSLVNLWLNAIVSVLVWMGGERIPVIHTGQLLAGPLGRWWTILVYVLVVLGGFALGSRRARRTIIALLVVASNLALLGAAVSDGRSPGLRIEFTTVPGGIAALVSNPASKQNDLIVTGLRRKTYPIDEKILRPWLERRGVDTFERLFVLTADYDAVDDLLRLAELARCRRLFVNAELRPSVSDQMRHLGLNERDVVVSYLTDSNPGLDSTGYFRQGRGLLLRTDCASLLLVDRVEPQCLGVAGRPGVNYLAIGRKWTGSADDWARLHNLGYTAIICSRFEQLSEKAYYDPSLEPDNPTPHYCRDLSRGDRQYLSLPVSGP